MRRSPQENKWPVPGRRGGPVRVLRRLGATLVALDLLGAGALLVVRPVWATVHAQTIRAAVPGATGSPSGSRPVGAAGASTGSRPGRGASPGNPAPGSISCATDLPLAQAPDTGYDFLCTQGGRPVTWSTDRIAMYSSGLTAAQRAALAAAVSQWARPAGFTVSDAPTPAAADVTVTGMALGAGQVGYVEDGYTTVSYRCDPACAYYSARMELSTSVTLTADGWVSTILHELGHVAGLNHVSRLGEVMYPYLTAVPPVTYTAGDLAGLRLLASERGA